MVDKLDVSLEREASGTCIGIGAGNILGCAKDILPEKLLCGKLSPY